MEKSARLRFSPGFWKMLAAFAVLLALIGSKRVVESFAQPTIYGKDFLSGYLLAKAMAAGVDPYLPLPELALRFGIPSKVDNLNHPTPHTFATGWLCYPLSWLPYEKAAVVWLLFELVCLAIAVRLLLRGLQIEVTPQRWLLGCGLALAWIPVIDDLWLGQFSLVLLVLWLSVWQDLRAERDVRAGLWLGLMMTLKLVGWPVVLWLVLKRRWRGVFAAGATAAALHGAAIALHGWTLVRDYYFKVGPLVSAHYRTHDANYSLWTFGARLFAPFGLNFVTSPLWSAPLLAKVLAVALPVGILALGLWLAVRAQSFDLAFGSLICTSLLVNPIAWTHYLMVNCIVLSLILRRLQELDWPRVWAHRLMLVALPFGVTQTGWAMLAIMIGTYGSTTEGRPLVSFWASWVTVIPTLAVLALGWLLWRVQAPDQQTQADRVAQWEREMAAEWSPTT